MTAEQLFCILVGGAVTFMLAGIASQVTEALTMPPLKCPGPMSWLAISLVFAAFLCLTGMMALHWSGAVP